jgi:hypothetical protein
MRFNPLTPELNPSAQRCLPRIFIGILMFKEPLGVKGLISSSYALLGQ